MTIKLRDYQLHTLYTCMSDSRLIDERRVLKERYQRARVDDDQARMLELERSLKALESILCERKNPR